MGVVQARIPRGDGVGGKVSDNFCLCGVRQSEFLLRYGGSRKDNIAARRFLFTVAARDSLSLSLFLFLLLLSSSSPFGFSIRSRVPLLRSLVALPRRLMRPCEINSSPLSPRTLGSPPAPLGFPSSPPSLGGTLTVDFHRGHDPGIFDARNRARTHTPRSATAPGRFPLRLRLRALAGCLKHATR